MMAMLALFEADMKLIPLHGQYGIKKVSEGQFDEFTFNSRILHRLWNIHWIT
jgi:hypothetical protein